MNENIHISEKDVQKGHFSGGGYAFYRLPDAENYTFVSQQGRPEELVALDISGSFSGIAIAPFVVSAECPVILLSPDYSTHAKVCTEKRSSEGTFSYLEDSDSRRVAYTQSYEACHRRLIEGEVGKIVLSRRMALQNISEKPWDAVAMFHEACRRYPHNYVTLWWTERTGCWLVATPETLLKKASNEQWQTMALAGTMKWDECKKAGFENAWSEKNKEEQQYVATYIERRLFPFVTHMETSRTYTSKAADLAHLRTDFTFTLKEGTGLGTLLQSLHPTPAVCGVPQDTACQAIIRHEDSPRRYYAGFSGPINWEGESQLYVSLRCMEIAPQRALLYAGGGLLKDSHEEEEWTETQRKMRTMLRLFK